MVWGCLTCALYATLGLAQQSITAWGVTVARSVYLRMSDAEKANAAMRLVRDGETVYDAAAKMNMTPNSFINLIKRHLSRNAITEASEYRAIHMERLEMMFFNLMPEIRKGNPYAIKVGIDVLRRQAQLLGLDAPISVNVRRLSVEYAERYGLDDEERKLLFTQIRRHLSDAKNSGQDIMAVSAGIYDATFSNGNDGWDKSGE